MIHSGPWIRVSGTFTSETLTLRTFTFETLTLRTFTLETLTLRTFTFRTLTLRTFTFETLTLAVNEEMKNVPETQKAIKNDKSKHFLDICYFPLVRSLIYFSELHIAMAPKDYKLGRLRQLQAFIRDPVRLQDLRGRSGDTLKAKLR